MVGLTDVIPNPFGGFAPFPNSIMIPFMGTQSAVLGYDFGLSYEAGKRMIKSMDNEDFNKFIKNGDTIEFEGKQQNLLSVFSKKHYRNMVQEFTSRIPSSLALQDTIIEASVEIELKKANRTPSAMVEIIKAFGGASLKEIKAQLDQFSLVERTAILIAVPLLAVLYIFAGGVAPKEPFVNTGPKEPEPPGTIAGGIEHTEIIGHEQHPFHSEQEPPQTSPDLNTPDLGTKQIELRWQAYVIKDGVKTNVQSFKESHTQPEWKAIFVGWEKTLLTIKSNEKNTKTIIDFYIQYVSSLRIAYYNRFGVWL